jgi:hypothetical protein
MYLFSGIVAAAPARYCGTMGLAAGRYLPRAPEQGVLHTVVRTHLEEFLQHAAERTEGAGLPRFVEDEFRGFLTCGIVDHGFARPCATGLRRPASWRQTLKSPPCPTHLAKTAPPVYPAAAGRAPS